MRLQREPQDWWQWAIRRVMDGASGESRHFGINCESETIRTLTLNGGKPVDLDPDSQKETLTVVPVELCTSRASSRR